MALFFIAPHAWALVPSSGSSEGEGAGGGALDPTITTTTSRDKVQIIIGQLPANTVTTITILPNENMPLDSLKINPRAGLANIEITITTPDAKPARISHELEGIVSDYIQIDTNIRDSDLNSATIGFKVPLSFINASNIDKGSVVMSRYSDSKWYALNTTMEGDDGSFVYYSSDTPGFSVFGISGTALSTPATTTGPEMTAEPATITKPPVPAKMASPALKTAFAFLAIAAIAALLSILEKK